MIDVEHRALSTFKEELTAFIHLFVERFGNVADHGLQAFGINERIGDDLFGIERFGAKELRQDEVMELHDRAHLFGKTFRMIEVSDAHSAAGHLVFIGRTDAAAGRADLLRAQSRFTSLIERNVVRHDERAVARNTQTLFNIGHAYSVEFVDFAEESFRGEDNAVADIAGARSMHDARGDQTQDGLLAVNDEGMPGIMAAVEAHHPGSLFRQPIDDFALAFVAPLSADHDNILAHLKSLINLNWRKFPSCCSIFRALRKRWSAARSSGERRRHACGRPGSF